MDDICTRDQCSWQRVAVGNNASVNAALPTATTLEERVTASSGGIRTPFAMHDASKATHDKTNYAKTRYDKTKLPRQIEDFQLQGWRQTCITAAPRAALADAKRMKVRPTLFTHGRPDASNNS